MHRSIIVLAALIALVSPAAAQDCDGAKVAGRVLTGSGGEAAGLSIEGGRVAALHRTAMTEPDDCTIILPEGAVALPGLTDGHAHLLGIGLREMTLNLEGASSVADLQDRLREAASGTRGAIIGRGWIETGWPKREGGGRMPDRRDLDAVVKDRVVILTRADGHALVANSAALWLAKVTAETPDPEGGRIVKRDGRMTGVLVDAAMGLLDDQVPKLDDRRRREALRRGAALYAARGWIGVQNMSVDAADLPILADLARRGALPLRVHSYVTPEALSVVEGPSCDETGLACVQGVKAYVDGALGSRGAWLFEPYADEPGTTGLQLITPEDARAVYAEAASKGLQVTTHAIGDRGNAAVLDWYADQMPGPAEGRPGGEGARWRIEHAQVVRPADLPRFARQGVIASMQPSHAIGDLHFAPDRLGDARLDGAYAWASLRGTGAVVVGGSDAPVEQGDPRIELYAATERRDLDGFQGEDWRAREALSRGAALDLFTRAAAYAVFDEAERGTLEPGMAADLSVFCGDPFAGPPRDGKEAATPLFTMIAGEVVSGDPEAGCPAGEASAE